MTRVYVAGPLFNTHERWYLERIGEALEAAGYSVFLPHRDAGVIEEFTLETRRRVFQTDIDAMDNCDICVALLTGADHDSGTSSEIGYFYARGKPIFGVSDDGRRLNNMIWGMCDEGKTIVRTIDELVPMITARQAS
jgi:nucleoside 2-deoxyribosyltransferase